MCLEPLDYATVETDAKRSVQYRERISISVVGSGSKVSNQPERKVSNLFGPSIPEAQNNFSQSLLPQGFKQPERFSLVPYDSYRISLIQV